LNVKRALLLAVAALLLVGCAGDDSADEEATDTVTLPAFGNARVYWLRNGKVWPVLREVQASGDAATTVMDDLVAGPSPQEQELELTTAVPAAAASEVVVENGIATVELDEQLSAEGRAQVVYTLTQFPTIESVEIEGTSYTRDDFEEQTPSVLVESPLSFEEVVSPLRAEGTANTFEANFAFTIADSEGALLAENFVTATSGTGTRGTFEFSEAFTADPGEEITLTVFENSAEDGSRMNEVEIPLTMAP
jgi:germination protein M